MTNRTLFITLTTATAFALSACATAPQSSTKEVRKPTAVDVMKNGGIYTYTKPTEPIYANSSAELAERFVGRHVDELPDAQSSTKAVQNGNEVVCKVVGRTHTRLRKKKICATKKESDLQKLKAKELMREQGVVRKQLESRPSTTDLF